MVTFKHIQKCLELAVNDRFFLLVNWSSRGALGMPWVSLSVKLQPLDLGEDVFRLLEMLARRLYRLELQSSPKGLDCARAACG